MGSAAAATLGTHAVPVYEIYKAGADPYWAEGLDLLGTLTGLAAVVIPHYDNREGGTHDTRFCYLGERRLSLMEPMLPSGTGVLGVDEHTALLLDTTTRTATVAGNGLLTVRQPGRSQTFGAGSVLDLEQLAALLRGGRCSDAGFGRTRPRRRLRSLRRRWRSRCVPARRRPRAAFETALDARDVDGCVAAILELEQAVHAWSADTLQSDDQDHARQVLRTMVVRLGEVAEAGIGDPREVLRPYVDLLLELRASARAAKDFATSDLVRDRLAAAGVEVETPLTGATWAVA